jgi:hypothetical protein
MGVVPTHVWAFYLLINTFLRRIPGSDFGFPFKCSTIYFVFKIALIVIKWYRKTNLLKIVAGVDTSDGDGKVIIDKNIQISYLP